MTAVALECHNSLRHYNYLHITQELYVTHTVCDKKNYSPKNFCAIFLATFGILTQNLRDLLCFS